MANENPYGLFPRTLAAHERMLAKLAAQRDADFKSDIDAYLSRWSERPCTLEEARFYNENEPHTSARDAAEEIMCARY